MKRIPVILAAAALSAATLGFASYSTSTPLAAATAPPMPPDPNAAVTPLPSAAPSVLASPTPIPLLPGATPKGGKGAASPKPSPTPPKDNRVGYEGVWEVQIQHGDQTSYTHFALKQQQNALTGVYMDAQNKKYPLAGSVDGTHLRIVVSMPDGSTQVFDGKVDGTTDMIGTLTSGNDHTYFTAAYRPKENWMENINAAPGGLGGGLPTGGSPTTPH